MTDIGLTWQSERAIDLWSRCPRGFYGNIEGKCGREKMNVVAGFRIAFWLRSRNWCSGYAWGLILFGMGESYLVGE